MHRVALPEGGMRERTCSSRRYKIENCLEWDDPNKELDALFAVFGAASPRLITYDTVGCVTPDIYDKIAGLTQFGAEKGANDFMQAEIAAGRCRVLRKDSAVMTNKNMTVGKFELVRVRPKGEKVDYWTAAEAIAGE